MNNKNKNYYGKLTTKQEFNPRRLYKCKCLLPRDEKRLNKQNKEAKVEETYRSRKRASPKVEMPSSSLAC